MLPGAVHAQLEVRTNEIPQSVFAGGERPVAVTFHNPADRPVGTVLRTQIYQAGFATVVPLGEPRHWKELEVLPRQTVVESTWLAFPAVKKETRFLVQWLDEKSKILGSAEVMAYPTNLLEALKPMAGEKPLGVLDPLNQLKPLLKGLSVDFEDLTDNGLRSFSGKLAIIGPFQSKTQMYEGLADQIQSLARRGTAIVWVQAPPEKRGQTSALVLQCAGETNRGCGCPARIGGQPAGQSAISIESGLFLPTGIASGKPAAARPTALK